MAHKIPHITVDGIILEQGMVLLIRRGNPPFKGLWAFPGGFVEYGESVEDAVCREVFEETGLKTCVVSLVGVFSDPDRDPRGHTITVAFRLKQAGGALQSGDDAADVKFFKVDELPRLAFDHALILQKVLSES